MLARKLLALHMDRATEEHRMEQIVEALSSRLYYDGHPINRREAKDDLGLKVVDSSAELEDVLWTLFREYEQEMQLLEPYHPALELVQSGTQVPVGTVATYAPPQPHHLGYLQSAALSHVYLQEYEVAGTRLPNGLVQATLALRSHGWREES